MNIWKERINTFLHYTDLMKELVKKDLKLKYRRSFLGYLWSILNPLFIMLIMTIVFSYMFQRNIVNFPVYLMCGRTLYEFMSTSTKQSMMSIRGNAALIKKIYIPKYVFPLAKVTSGMVDCLFSLGALVIVMVITRAPFTPYFLLFPFVMLQLYIFCCGLGFFLAQMIVFFRDIQYIYNAVLTAWMYLTAIFYPISSLPDSIRWFVEHCNPLYFYVAQFRALIHEGRFPDTYYIIAGCISALVMLVIGVFFFKKKQDKFILYI